MKAKVLIEVTIENDDFEEIKDNIREGIEVFRELSDKVRVIKAEVTMVKPSVFSDQLLES